MGGTIPLPDPEIAKLKHEIVMLREGLSRAAGVMEGMSIGLRSEDKDSKLAASLSTEAFKARRYLEGKPL